MGILLFTLMIALAWCFIVPPADSERGGDQHIVSLRWLVEGWTVLFAWSMLLWAMGAATTPRRRDGGTVRTAAVAVAAWLWLSFPIWLGPTMGARGWDAPVWVTTIHPLFAMNAAVIELGIWTQQPVAYQLTPFGQDVAYALPRSVWPFVATHLLIASGLLAFASARRRLRAAASRRGSAEARPGRLV